MLTIAVFDTRVGNLHSLSRALEAGGARVRVEPDPARLVDADAMVLPGVGAYPAAAARLAPAADAVRAAIAEGAPALGICLGMQLLLESSEEGAGAGLGIIPGRVRRLRAPRVPHMGWNDVVPVASPGTPPGSRPDTPPRPAAGANARTATRTQAGAGATGATDAASGSGVDPLFRGLGDLVAYHAHSFVVEPRHPRHVIAWAEYAGERFPAAVRRWNAWGVQFHPEKSGAAAIRLLRNFLAEVAR